MKGLRVSDMSGPRVRGAVTFVATMALGAVPAAAFPVANAWPLPAPGAADPIMSGVWPVRVAPPLVSGPAPAAPRAPGRVRRPARPPAPSVSDMEHLTDDPPLSPGGKAERDADPRDRRVGIEGAVDRVPRGVPLLPAPSGPSAAGLPSGCGVWSWTYRDAGHAKGSGLVSCTGRQPALGARTVLERRRWYGWQVLDDDDSKRSGAEQVASVSRWRCSGTGDYTYASGAYGTVMAANGHMYRGAVATRNRFGC